MRSLTGYLDEYAESHQNETNKKIHNICVPAIMWSLLGLLSTFEINSEFNVAHILTLGALIFYVFFKNVKLFFTMFVVVNLMFLSFSFVPHLRTTSIVVFVLAWVGQFYGHKVEGKKPSFFKDLEFLLIGPLWVLQKFAPKLIGLTK